MPVSSVEAARGTPSSSDFGFGAHINPSGLHTEQAVDVANTLCLDWIAIEINWERISPDANTNYWNEVDATFLEIGQATSSVMVSITNPPAWALTPYGPNSDLTLRFVSELISRYGNKISALEIFPGANITEDWGTTPNPVAYATMLYQLHYLFPDQLIIAGGLKPINQNRAKTDMDDLVFLNSLYQTGIQDYISIISLDLSTTTGEPLAAPNGIEHHYLRHYQEIRQVMLENSHENGLIWVTHLQAPSGKINSSDKAYQSQEKQAEWLAKAYSQLRANLFIGVAFHNGLNPVTENDQTALISSELVYHPFYPHLKGLILENAPEAFLEQRSKPKERRMLANH
jgi:hypothetical protein